MVGGTERARQLDGEMWEDRLAVCMEVFSKDQGFLQGQRFAPTGYSRSSTAHPRR